MTQSRIVIIGEVAAGPKAAAKVTRLAPDADVTTVRVGELPRDREIVAFCKISLRGYEAALIAAAAGYDAKYMDGGVAMWPYERLTS